MLVKKPVKKNRLQDVEVSEVSIVDTPANKRNFLLYKRESDIDFFNLSEGQIDGLDLLQKLQDAATNLKISDPPLYDEMNSCPNNFDFSFDDDGEIVITKKTPKRSKLNREPLPYSPEPPPKDETPSHKFDYQTGKWHPKGRR